MIKKNAQNELRVALGRCKTFLFYVALFSACINLLYLAPTIYLMQVYDRVLQSGSIPTLVFLTLITLAALATLAGLDYLRAHLLTKMGIRLDDMLAARVYQALMDQAISAPEPSRAQAVRDLDNIRQFLTSQPIHAVFDAPWTPIYIAVAFLLHPVIGYTCMAFALILLVMAILNEVVTRKQLGVANAAAIKNYGFTDTTLRNAEVVQALGMFSTILPLWKADRGGLMNNQAAAGFKGAAVSSAIRFLRLAMQAFILGIAAYYVIERTLTPGAVFAATVLLGRALQPIEQVVGMCKQAVSAQQAYRRLLPLLSGNPPRQSSMTLPAPEGRVSVEKLTYRLMSRDEPILDNVSFALAAGEALAVIGPSAAGKSTLARLIVGVLPPTAGVVRLDGADVYRWPRDHFGRFAGYLPQDVELFPGTVAANIARFRSVSSETIVEAARRAGVHELILRLPQGYETELGDNASVLSAGQRQRIALARAILELPKLLVLDEPNSNLDSVGENVLIDCLTQLKGLGTTIIVISHRITTVSFVDKILALNNGVVEAFGPRAEVLARFTRPAVVKSMTPAMAENVAS
jgi:PrtD family type I secretion system ABC transporter